MIYLVPVVYEMTGHITVEADDPVQAIERARNVYRKKQRHSIEDANIHIDFAKGDNINSVITLDLESESK